MADADRAIGAGVFLDKRGFFRSGTSGADVEALRQTASADYSSRASRSARSDLPTWLPDTERPLSHRPLPHSSRFMAAVLSRLDAG